MSLPSPGWLVVISTLAIAALIVPAALKQLSTRRLQRLQRRDDLFDQLTESPDEEAVDQEKLARNQIKLFHRGLKRMVFFCLAIMLSVALAIPYFSTLPAAFVSFFLGALTLVFGTAAKPAIENFIAGVVLAFSQTINIGDTVLLDDEHYGTIEDLGYTHCVVRIWDWRRYVVPNGEMLNKCFVNHSLRDTFQLAYVEFQVAPDTDMNVVEELCVEVPKKSKYFANYEDPALWVMEMKKDSIVCWCGAWADSPSDAWMLKSEIRQGLVKEFQSRGITTHSVRVIHEPHGGPTPRPKPAKSPKEEAS